MSMMLTGLRTSLGAIRFFRSGYSCSATAKASDLACAIAKGALRGAGGAFASVGMHGSMKPGYLRIFDGLPQSIPG